MATPLNSTRGWYLIALLLLTNVAGIYGGRGSKGVQYATQCFCGRDGTDYARFGQTGENECDTACRGDGTQICGGTWRLNVYHIRNSWDSNEWSELPSWWPDSWDPAGSEDSWQESEDSNEESESWQESGSDNSRGDSDLSYSWEWSSEEEHDEEARRECTNALGMESRDISNNQLDASSFYTGQGGLHAWKGRLHNDEYWGTAGPECQPTDAWIGVDLKRVTTLNGIVTQGSTHPYREWVDELQIQYGNSTSSMRYIMDDRGRPKTFSANEDEEEPVRIIFPDLIRARYLAILPTHCRNWCSLRFEVVGCIEDNQHCRSDSCLNGGTCVRSDVITGDEIPPYCQCTPGYSGMNCEFGIVTTDCRDSLGMQSREIVNAQITSSSSYPGSEPWKARLNSIVYWAPATSLTSDEWIQVDLLQMTKVTGLVTQSGHGVDKWVEELRIQFGRSPDALIYMMDPREREPMTFTANSDKYTDVGISFPVTIRTQYLVIRPKSCHVWCALRFEIIGCAMDPCEINPCIHNGRCRTSATGDFYCDCPREWIGDVCEIENPCHPNPCINGGSCDADHDDVIGLIATPYCQCQSGYSGKYCEIEILIFDACSRDPCFNGASCWTEPYSTTQYHCECADDFIGTHCETPVTDPCDDEPCLFGFCISKVSGFQCECDYGYTDGDLCENDVMKPEIYCEAGLSQQIDAGDDSETIYWDLPYAWDNSEDHDIAGNQVTVWCDPPSGTVFDVGTNNVWCYAIDASNNKANCSFEVQISRLEVPEIDCIGDLTMPAGQGKKYATVTYPDPSTPNANSYNCWPESGSNFYIGDTTVTCQAWLNGVSARCNFNVLVRDLQKPTITCPANKAAKTAYQASYNQVWFQLPEASDNSGLVHTWCEPAPGTIFYLGGEVVICYAIDDHENEETCSFEIEVYDEEQPRISCPGRKIIPTEWDRATSEIWFSGEIQTWDNSEDYVEVVCDPREGFFGLGNTDVNCVATDQSGNTDECSFRVTVYDDQPPHIICPTDMYVKRDPNEQGVKIDWEVEAKDNAADSPSWHCRPTMDHVFQYGTTTVTCVAEDFDDNRANCQFNVEVTDYDVPEIYCPDDIELETLPGEDFNRAKWASPTYTTGASREVTVECDQEPGSDFQIGSHMVECTVTNGYGIASSCVFFVDIKDNEAPTIQCPANRIILSENGDPVTPVYTDGPSYTDNSGIANMFCNPHLKTAFGIGSHTITCSAIDRSGNMDSCSFGIRVVGVVSTDPCEGDSDQCNGNGRCITTSVTAKEYTCICNDGWKGQFCEEPVDACDGDLGQCNGRGACEVWDVSPVGYRCDCNDNWTAEFCTDVIIDHCISSPCNRDGSEACINLPDGDGYECSCRWQWSGVHCDVFGAGTGDTTTKNTDVTDGGGKVVNNAQSGVDTGAIIGSAAAGLVLIIVVLIVVIVIVAYRNRSTKIRRESTMPLAAVPIDRRISESSLANKVKGVENPSFSSKQDSRYTFATAPSSSHPPPRLVVNAPPPNMPPPAYTQSQQPAAMYTGGGAVYDNKIDGPIAANNSGMSVIYDNGAGSTGTYGAYERPDGFGNNNYEEIDASSGYATIGADYVAYTGLKKH